MDFKLPSSTGMQDFWDEHRKFLKISLAKEVFLKAVVTKDTRLEDISEAIKIIKDIKQDLVFILQPQGGLERVLEVKLGYFRDFCRKEQIEVMVVVQLHKELGIK